MFIASANGAELLRIGKRPGARFTVESSWRSGEMRSDVNSAVLVDGAIYGFDRGILQSVDAGSGEVGWRQRGFGRGSLITADGKLIVLGENGELALVAVDAREYRPIASARITSGRNWTAPSLAAGRLYVRSNDTLLSVDLTGGGED